MHKGRSPLPVINEVEVRGVVVGVFFRENCYIVSSPKTKEAIVIDPGDEPETVLELARDMGVSIKLIANTHGHTDHILGIRGIQERTSARFLIHPSEIPILQRGTQQVTSRLGRSEEEPPEPEGFVSDGDTVSVAGLDLRVIHTPGHTPGSVSYYVNGLLFSGDTLFRGSVGRTDGPGSHQQIMASITNKLLALPDDTIALPGHELETTIRNERLSNPFILQALQQAGK